VVLCLPLDPRLAGSNPAEDDGLLRVIKIHSTTSFGGEAKPSVPSRRFTACKRTLRAWKRCFVSKIQRLCVSPMFLLVHYQMALADESGLSRNCAEAAGLPPTTLKHYDKLTWSTIPEWANGPKSLYRKKQLNFPQLAVHNPGIYTVNISCVT
jgi:hypothetical protein